VSIPLVEVCKNAFLGLLSPPCCAACEAPLSAARLFCSSCDEGVAPLVDRLEGEFPLIAAGAYGGSVARAITRFKYGARPDLAAPLAERLVAVLSLAAFIGPATVVPVPLHPHKLAARGYNQSALLGARLSQRAGLRFRPLALRRVRSTREQASLSREERLVNVAAAMAPRESLAGEHVVLVDDVVTTGATVLAGARALLCGGAARVTIAAVARAVASNDAAEPAARCGTP
jgi:ComF family protein